MNLIIIFCHLYLFILKVTFPSESIPENNFLSAINKISTIGNFDELSISVKQ